MSADLTASTPVRNKFLANKMLPFLQKDSPLMPDDRWILKSLRGMYATIPAFRRDVRAGGFLLAAAVGVAAVAVTAGVAGAVAGVGLLTALGIGGVYGLAAEGVIGYSRLRPADKKGHKIAGVVLAAAAFACAPLVVPLGGLAALGAIAAGAATVLGAGSYLSGKGKKIANRFETETAPQLLEDIKTRYGDYKKQEMMAAIAAHQYASAVKRAEAKGETPPAPLAVEATGPLTKREALKILFGRAGKAAEPAASVVVTAAKSLTL